MNALTISAITWKFGINDPSFIAWLIFAGYFAVAFQCWRRQNVEGNSGRRGISTLWAVMACLLIFLGLNKQLDLHVLAMELAREWSSNPTPFHLLTGGILAAVGLLCLGAVGYGLIAVRDAGGQLRWTYGILAGLMIFQVLRFLPGPLSELLVVHVFTEQEGLLHIHIVELLELGCLCGIGWLAGRFPYRGCRSTGSDPTADRHPIGTGGRPIGGP